MAGVKKDYAEAYGRARDALYRRVRHLGKGAYASVDEHENVKTKQRVAIKKVQRQRLDWGMNLGAIKELQVMFELRHPGIMELYEVYPYCERLHIVMELGSGTLEGHLKNGNVVLRERDTQRLAKEMMAALAYCHARGVMHRDLKPENLLFSKDGRLKLADFGLASTVAEPGEGKFYKVATSFYRAPELCMRSDCHGPAVDMWSAGCIVAELFTRRPVLAGRPLPLPGAADQSQLSETYGQLSEIVRLLGAPDPATWPGVDKLPGFVAFKPSPVPPPSLAEVVPDAPPQALDLIGKLLALNPADRLTAEQALAHPWLAEVPLPYEAPAATAGGRG